MPLAQQMALRKISCAWIEWAVCELELRWLFEKQSPLSAPRQDVTCEKTRSVLFVCTWAQDERPADLLL
jgi:hypothetical protein